MQKEYSLTKKPLHLGGEYERMNNRGETEVSIGLLIGIFMVVVIGTALLTSSAQNLGPVRNTVAIANDTYSGTNATNTSIAGKLWTGLVVYNATNDILVSAGNYTLYNNIVVDGTETARLEMNVVNNSDLNNDWLISGTFQQTSYDTSAGGRAIAGLIIVFFALAIAVVVLVPTLRNRVFDMIGK